MADTKQRILRKLYYDEGGFMSTANLYKDAKQKQADITYADVKEWLANQTSTQTLKKRTLFNSDAAEHPLQQIAIDLADYSKSKEHNDGFAYILMGVDYFSKFLVAYPLKTKQGIDLAGALETTIKELEKWKHW